MSYKKESKTGRLGLTKLALSVPMSKRKSTIASKRSPRKRGISRSYKSYMSQGRNNSLTTIGESRKQLSGIVISSFRSLPHKRSSKPKSESRWQTVDKPISLTSSS